MTRMYDRPTLGPNGWVVDETPTPHPISWSLDASGNPVGLVGPDGGVRALPSYRDNRAIVLGDSQAAHGVVSPNAVSYDNATGVLTVGNAASHNLWPTQPVSFTVKGAPQWNLWGATATKTSATEFTLQGTAGLGSAPTLADCRWLNSYQISDENPIAHARRLMGGDVRIVRRGVPGETTAQILARASDLATLVYPRAIVLIHAGHNDCPSVNVATAYTNAAAAAANILSIARYVRGLGGIPVVATVTPCGSSYAPSSGTNATFTVALMTLNRLLWEQSEGEYQVVDFYKTLVDATSAGGNALADYTDTSHLHWSPRGAKILGTELSVLLAKLMPAVVTRLPKSQFDGYSATNPNSRNIYDNATAQTASGGTVGGTNFTGTAAASFNMQGAALSAHGVCSVVSVGDGTGNAQRIVWQPNANGDTCQFRLINAQTRVVPGRTYQCAARLRISGVAANAKLRYIQLVLVANFDAAGVVNGPYDGNSTNTAVAKFDNSADIDVVMCTPPATVPDTVSVVTSFYGQLFMGGDAAGSDLTIEVSQVEIREVDTATWEG